MRTRSGTALALGLAAFPAASDADAATLGVVSDFETGSQGWSSGFRNPNPPVVVADGGPQGIGDAFLRVTANGDPGFPGPGGKLVFFNPLAPWRGNYTSAGIAAIEMDLKNLTEAALEIRIEIEGPIASNHIISTTAAQLAAFQDWTHFRIPIEATDFAGANVAAALANVREIRIFHNPEATESMLAPPIVAQLGFDNIRAVPEPSTLLLLATGLAGLVARRSAPSARPRRPAWRGRPRSRPRAACGA